MLRKWNRFLSFILAIALIATTFHSDLATIRVFADGDEQDVQVEEPVEEPVVEEPVVEEPVVEEPVVEEPEEPAPAPEEVYQEPVEEPAAPEEVTTPEEPAAPVEPAAPETPETQEPKEDEPETPEAEVVEPEEEEIEVEPEEETPENKRTLSDEEIAAIVEGLTEEGLAALESEYSAEDFAAIKSAFEAKMKEAEEEEELEEKLVTVSYNASLGGLVSRSSETININDEEAKFEGSTATAFNKYYQFVAWVDADGNTVCSEATFVPSDIEEDATFTANFMKLSEMPAQSFGGSAGGMNVSVSADEGIFPEGTTMHVSAISDDEALDAAKDAIGEEVQQAKGVDITFRNADGEEIEPADARYVHVSISLATELEGDSFSVVHKDDSGNADVIADASADGAEFEANQFSVYIVAGSGDSSADTDLSKATRTYIFHNGDEIFNTQVLKKGEKLLNPGIPNMDPNQEFLGWFIGNTDVSPDFDTELGVFEADETINVNARIRYTFYVTLIGQEGERVQVYKAVVVGDEEARVYPVIGYQPKNENQAFKGWGLSPDATKAEPYVDARDVDTLYALIVDAYWIRFDENDGGTGGGASYTKPAYVEMNKPCTEAEPDDPVRAGYTFDGWYTEKGANPGEVAGERFDFGSTIDHDIILYAKWNENSTAPYTVNIWKQKVSDAVGASQKTYDFVESHVITGPTNANVSTVVGQYTRYNYTGFSYSTYDSVYGEGKDPTTVIRAKGDTVINVYYNRNTYTLTFKDGNKTVKTITALYDQNIADNFPITGYTNSRWEAQNSSTFKYVLVVINNMPAENVTFKKASDVTQTKTMEFWLQNIDDDNYSLKKSITAKYNFITEKEDFIDILGFTKHHSDPAFDEDGIALYLKDKATIKFYYTRNRYSITFKDNFDGTTSDIEGVDAKFSSIPYEKNLASYESVAPGGVEREGYEFKGWYEDLSGQTPFNWSSEMPAANKILYAHYEPLWYNITLDTQDGTLPSGQIDDFWVVYHGTVSRESIEGTTKDGYDLVGWFEGDTAYSYGEVDHDTHLVARWRKKGNAQIVYVAEPNGTEPPTDAYKYATDSAVVVARPPKANEGYTFVGWKIVGDSSGTIYYPNNCFTIQSGYIVNGVVTLKAVYDATGPNGGPTTYITYYSNDGTGRSKKVSTVDDDPLLVNQSVIALTADACGFDRAGYEFLGWSRTSGDSATVEIEAGKEIAADNDGIPNALYAVWKQITGSYIVEYYKGKVTDSTDLAHYLGSVGPYTVAADTVLTENDVNLNLRKPDNGYQDGEFYGDTTVYAGDGNVIRVLYKPIKVTVTVEGTHETYTYDGEKHTVSGFRVTGITADTGYQASYVTYTGDSEAYKTHVVEEGNANEKALDINLFKNNSDLFDNDSVEFVLGSVKSNKVTITPATLTVVTPNATKIYDGEPLTAEGSIDGYVNNETATFTTTGTVTYPSEGVVNNTYSLVFDKSAKESDYTVDATVGKLQVFENDKVKITVTTEGGTYTYDGQEHGATVTYSEIPEGYTVTEAASSATATNVYEGTVTATADKFVIRNSKGEDVTESLDIEYVNGSIKITAAPITIATETASKVYDGEALTAPGSFEGLVNNETATFTVTGSQLAVGSSDNTYTLTWDGSADERNYYIASKTIGTLTVSKYADEIVVTTTGGEFTYDGQPHGATVSYPELPTGYRVAEARSTATATNVSEGTVTAKADVFKIVNAQDEDVTGTLNIRYIDGSIKITPATLTIKTESASKSYDGKALTAPGSIDGLVNNETATFEVTGNITKVGTTPNSYKLTWDGTADESNYTVDETVGTLEVTEYAGLIEVITTGEIAEYDGKAHGATVEVKGLPTGYSVGKAVSNATATDVTVTDVIADCDELVILNQDGEDVTNALTISKTPGFIRITPAKVIITVEGDKRIYKYSGYEQKAEGFAITDISNDLYSEDMLSFTGDAIAKGKLPNTYMMNLKAEQFTNSDTNFEVEFVIDDGYLTIEPLGPGEKFRITAIAYDATREYTGNYYDGFGYELTGEGPTQGLIADAIDRVENFFRSTFGGITADAAGEGGDPTVTINGIEFTVRGLYVPTRERNAGEYALPIEGTMRVYDGADDVTDQFELVERRAGTLTISKMVINLTSGSGTKVYDGTALTNSTITSDKNWGVGDTVAYNITGTQTQVGESNNLFTAVGTNGTDLDRNYIINYTYGRLIVTSAPAPTPTPTPDPTPAPTPGGTTIADAPTPTAPAPAPAPAPAAVLGATRDTDGAAVLGARRGRTEDTANLPGRIMAALIAAAVAAALLLTKKKESEEEDQK